MHQQYAAFALRLLTLVQLLVTPLPVWAVQVDDFLV